MQNVLFVAVVLVASLLSSMDHAAADGGAAVLTRVHIKNNEPHVCDIESACDFRWQAKSCKGEEVVDNDSPSWSPNCGGFEKGEVFKLHVWDVDPLHDNYLGYCSLTVPLAREARSVTCVNPSWDATLVFQ